MHHCLTIQDIILDICQHLHNEESPDGTTSKTSMVTLAALAGTCKAFHEPAADSLWHSLSSLVPVIMCLPSDAYQLKRYKRNKQQPLLSLKLLQLIRDLTPVDYDRITHYSHRVRVFRLQCYFNGPIRLDTQVLPVLWSRKPYTGPLLPNLRVLNIPASKFMGMAIYPRLVAGASLHSMRIELDEEHHLHHDFLDNVAALLKQTVPSLRTFKLHSRGPKSSELRDSPMFVDQLCRIPSLEVLGVYCNIRFTASATLRLSELPALRRFNFSIDKQYVDDTADVELKPAPFRMLQELKIGTDDFENCEKLLQRGWFGSIKSIKLGHGVPRLQWDLEFVFSALSKHCPQLEHVECKSHYRNCEALPVSHRVLAPLLLFSNLSGLVITSCASFDMDDTTLAILAKSWLNLEILRLDDSTSASVPKITLSGLVSFVNSCSKLSDLAIRVNALEVPPFSLLGDIVPCLTLRTLNVCSSPVAKPHEVAPFLTVVFPNLESLQNHWDCKGEDDDADYTDEEQEYNITWMSIRSLLAPTMSSHDHKRAFSGEL